MLLSVITVVFNGAATIERTITSVLEQSGENIQYIIIDGGSTDGTLDIIKKYEDKIAYWISEPDEGLYDAMNKGIKKATGEWVSFINSDDWYEKNAFQIFFQRAQGSSADILYGKVSRIENGEKNGYVGINKEMNPEFLHTENLYCHQGLFIRRKTFELIGLYDCRYKIWADYDWILRAHALGIDPEFIDECVANFTMGGISCVSDTIIEAKEIVIKHYRNHKRIGCLERGIGRVIFDYCCVYDQNIFAPLLQPYDSVYIWGTGVYGKKIYELLNKLHCNVAGFIDSNRAKDYFENMPVYSLEMVIKSDDFVKDDMFGICVASEKYEPEMLEELEKNMVAEKKYIFLGQFFEVALQAYLEKRND